MATLGKNGRFGNQIFQYFFLKIVEKELGYEIRCPEWAGNRFFGISTTLKLEEQIFRIPFEAVSKKTDTPEIDLNRLNKIINQNNLSSIDISGYFHYHTSHLVKYRDLFINTFKPKDNFNKTFYGRFTKPIIAVHVRATDYIEHEKNNGGYGFAITPSFNEIAKIIKSQISSNQENTLIYLASDDLIYASTELSRYGIKHLTRLDLDPLNEFDPLEIDFYILSMANQLLISNSTFSFSAAMLNTKARKFFRPNINNKKYELFEPWSDYILHEKKRPMLYL